MAIGIGRTILFAIACASWTPAQEPAPQTERSPATVPVLTRRSSPRPAETPAAVEVATIPLTVPKGTPVQVILDKEVRLKTAGQPIHGRVAEAIYAFDKIVIPVGAQVIGQISKIDNVSPSQRTLSVLDADFTPTRKVELEFSELILANGKQIPIHTRVTLGSGQVIQFVTSADDKRKENGAKGTAAQKAKQAKHDVKQEWDSAMKQITEPQKLHRIKRYAVARLPVHPQYIDAGTVYFAELQAPLDFGTEPLAPEIASAMGTPLPAASLVRARLVTPLNSSISKKGDEVEAVLSQPLLDGERLILPQDSRLKGTVVQAQPARRLHRNGQLRIAFRELVPPDGISQLVNASIEGVEAAKGENVELDLEGGAKARSSKTRYLSTAISVGLAAVSQGGDKEHVGGVSSQANGATNRIAGGAVGFKMIGIILGATVHSRVFGASMGAYGAGISVYTHFIARGQDVVFPKNTAMAVGIGTRAAPPHPPGAATLGTKSPN